jgi:hypothetical protein
MIEPQRDGKLARDQLWAPSIAVSEDHEQLIPSIAIEQPSLLSLRMSRSMLARLLVRAAMPPSPLESASSSINLGGRM